MLDRVLRELRLPAIKPMWAKFAEQADKESWPAAGFRGSTVYLRPSPRPNIGPAGCPTVNAGRPMICGLPGGFAILGLARGGTLPGDAKRVGMYDGPGCGRGNEQLLMHWDRCFGFPNRSQPQGL
jgi:hypothetical protein